MSDEVVDAANRNSCGPKVSCGREALGHSPADSEARAADVTLINLNLMLADLGGKLDRQNYLPLELLYIAACLQQAGHPVELIDYQVILPGGEISVCFLNEKLDFLRAK